jgi:protein phosphatase
MLSQITHDDTYVQSLVDAGRLTAEEANHHPRKSVILRALNGADIEPDVSLREARRGDRYLLCSDGLTDVVRADTILDEMSLGDPQDCADRLVGLALRGGGPDNVTSHRRRRRGRHRRRRPAGGRGCRRRPGC